MTEYETVTLYQDRLVPVPEDLTVTFPIPDAPDELDTVALGAHLKACRAWLFDANENARDIDALGEVYE